MNPLIALALQFAPDVAKALAGDGAGRVAASVTDAVAQAAGTSQADAAQIALAQDPAKLADLRIKLAGIAAQAEADRRANELEQIKAQIADTENARDTFAALAKSGNVVGLAPLFVSGVVTVGFFAILAWLLYREPTLSADANVVQLINITIGALTAAFATVVNFWLGSSHDSRIKDQIGAALQAQGAASASRGVTAALDAHSARIGAALDALRAGAVSTPPDAGTTPPPPPAPVAPAPPAVAPPAPAPATAPAVADPDSRFADAVALVLRLEGGYVDDPADPGGATNMGITLATLRGWRHDQSLGPDDVKALTQAEAEAIYRAEYWNKMQCGALPAGIDLCVFDFGVNAGPSRSVGLLQSLVGAPRDGAMGPITLAATAKQDAAALIRSFSDGRLAFYRGLPDWDRFGAGWTTRTQTVENAALGMTGGGSTA